MNKRIVWTLMVLLGLTALLAGCGPQGGAQETQPDVDATVQAAVAATRTVEAQQTQAEPTSQPTEAQPIEPPPEADTPTPPPGCTVQANALNLRNGPGLVYDPPITALARGADLAPIAVSPDGEWIQVQANGQNGWVSAAAQFVACNFDVASLPVGEVPPTPTPTNTPEATATAIPPTPTPLALFVPPVQGDAGDLEGELLIPRDALASTNPIIFGDKIDVRLKVREPKAGPEDGAGIDRVEIFITDEENGDVVYEHTENNAWYCAFGGGAPLCNQFFPAQNNYRWPDGTQIRDVDYQINMVAIPKDPNKNQGNWRFVFRVRLPQNAPQTASNLVVNFVQTAPGRVDGTVTDALAFQVEAFDTAAGNQDGAGIQQVDMRILDPSGRVVHERTERHAGYCGFGGGEPDCNIWVFRDHGNQWPGGAVVQDGEYTLQATVHAQSGAKKTVERRIRIQAP